MAKKKPTEEKTASPISQERTDYGFQLKLYPFRGVASGGLDAMVIHADVTRPKKGRKADIRYWFSGVVGTSSLSQGQMGQWTMALRNLMDEAHRVGESLRPSRAAAAM